MAMDRVIGVTKYVDFVSALHNFNVWNVIMAIFCIDLSVIHLNAQLQHI
jgi:hypothetical protein